MSVLPEKFIESMQKKLGHEFPKFSESLNTPSPVSVRINPRKNLSEEPGSSVPWTIFGRYLTTRPSFTLDPAFHAGTYYVQEASSMFLEQALKQTVDLDAPLTVLDVSAAPGGKSTHVLSLINNESLLVSNEVIRSRATILNENIQKWGYPNALVTNNDPEDFSSLQGFFDVIVVDAPCSGEGLFRKDPHAIREWSPQNVTLCASRQKRILHDILPALKENGILIYCTCTYNEDENENNIRWLSEENQLSSVRLKTEPQWGVEEVNRKSLYGYRFYPHRLNGEGFFISVLRKDEKSVSVRQKRKAGLPVPAKKITENLKPWLKEPDRHKFFQHNDRVFFVPQAVADAVEFLQPQLRIVNAGTSLATIKHDKAIPEHAAALSVELNADIFNTVTVDLNNAIKYLRKDQMTIDEYPGRGYSLVSYEGNFLGWVNVLDNRVNNLYPLEWRIRMNPDQK